MRNGETKTVSITMKAQEEERVLDLAVFVEPSTARSLLDGYLVQDAQNGLHKSKGQRQTSQMQTRGWSVDHTPRQHLPGRGHATQAEGLRGRRVAHALFFQKLSKRSVFLFV